MELIINELINSEEPKLCLNMIVKNESHIIKDTLDKLLQKVPIDYWVISDTGSTDNTKEIIINFFKEKNIKGELFVDEWKDFGYNRTKALEHAYGKSKYLLIIDADDEIHGDFVLPDLKMDSYFIQYGDVNGTSYVRPQIVNNKKKWMYYGVLHEALVCRENTNGHATINGNYYTISGRTSSRNQDKDKYLKDALILEKAYEEAFKNKAEIYNRYGFYCANSYYDYGKYEEAIKWYKITLDNNNWVQEKYVTCLRLYNCYNVLNQKETGFFYLVKSFSYDKERVECLCELITYYCINGMNDIAYGYYNIVKPFYNEKYLKYNLQGKLFLDVSKANFILPYYMILIADKMQDFDTIIQMYKILFIKKHIFSTQQNKNFFIGNLLYNLQFFIERVKNDTEFMKLFKEYIDFLISLNYPVYDYDFMVKYEIYGIIKPKLDTPLFTQDECFKSNKILFYTGYSPFKWNYTYSLTNALGGSETAAISLSQNFPKNYQIYIAGAVEEETIDNIKYVNLNNLNNLIKTTAFHTIIVSRYLNFYELYQNFSSYQTFIWGHDIVLFPYGTNLSVENIIKKWSPKINGCVCQTEWHKNLFISLYPELKEKMRIINNGINPELFTFNNKKVMNKFVYTSCSERGLKKLTQLWPKITENIPDSELFIASYNNFPNSEEDNTILEYIQKTPSITHVGKLNKTELYNLMSSAEYWLYPSYFQETSCITSLELLASEVVCLYYPVAGLVNTIGDYGLQISEGNEIDTLLNLSIKQKNELKKKGKEYAFNCSWKNRAVEWGNMIFSKETKETKETKEIQEKMNKPSIEKNNIKVINLKKREDRKKSMIEQFERENITNYEFIEAVDGNELKETDELRLLFEGNNFNYRKGVIGCALSHLNIYNSLINDANNDYYIVLEDDVDICIDFKSILSKITDKFVKQNIEHLALALSLSNSTYDISGNENEIHIFEKDVYKLWNIGFAYIISKQAAQNILSFVNNCSIKCAIDNPQSYGEIIKYNYANKFVVSHKDMSCFGSDINNNSNCLTFSINSENKKDIRIAFCDWWYDEYCGGSFDFYNNFITDILKKYGNIGEVIIVGPTQNPDVLFYSIFGNEHTKYPNVRKVFFSGEPFGIRAEANFNFTFDRNSDKNTRFPLWLGYMNDYLLEECQRRKKGVINVSKRENFCSFIANGEVKTTHRRTIVEKLSRYKKVHCGGNYLNNIGFNVPRGVNCSGKIEHNNKYKFAIAFENEDYPGYVTEKICDIFKSNCVPIYWGTKEVVNDFNPSTFINANDFANFDELVEYIIKVDNDDELYASFFKEPMFSNKWLDAFNDPNKTFYKNLADCIIGKNTNLYDNYLNASNPLKRKNICVIHNCNLKDIGLKRLEYLINHINKSKLIKKLEKIYINNIGIPISENKYGKKYDICNYSSNGQLCEHPTINKLKEMSENINNYNILYLHSKGITHDYGKKCINDWIDMMVYFIIYNHDICIEQLNKGYQAVGCNYTTNLSYAPSHFSGNFWWGDSDYIKQLPLLDSDSLNVENRFKNNRWDAEFWICKNNPRVFEIHNSNTDHYNNEYPSEKYCKNNINTSNKEITIYNIWHNKLFDHCYKNLDNYSLDKITMYDVNQKYSKEYNKEKKYNIVSEYKLDNYNSLYQATNYCQTSCLYHVFKNKLYTKTNYIGFIQYDMELESDFIYDMEQKINSSENNTYFYSLTVANKIDVSYICKPYDNSILEKYNNYFNTSHTYESIKGHHKADKFICLHTFVIPTKTFINMMTWYCTITDWLHKNYINGLYSESMSEVTEEIFGLFLLLQLIENDNIQLEELKLHHEWPNLHNNTNFINYKDTVHYFSLDKIIDNRISNQNINLSYFTDKDTTHSYLETYEKLMKDKCLTSKNILEIGVQYGGSMKLWNDYFVNANIYGIDISQAPIFLNEYKRINCLKMNAYSQDSIDYFSKQNIVFDFILDDGLHTLDSMIYFIKNYLQLLDTEGILIVEDVQDINWCDTFKTLVPNGYTYEIIDLRHIKNRWDDILFVIKKNKIIAENIKLEINEMNETKINKINNLSVMAIFKNETMNLKTWIEHYLWQGVEHFYLIDNDSSDNPLNILQEYIDKNIVTYYFKPEKYQQENNYRNVFDNENLKEKTKWLCICDLDEFFFGTEQKLVDAICEFDEYNVIYTNSFFYGSDNLIDHPKDIRTAILHREEDIENGTKYIFKPSAINDSSEIWIHWLVNSGTIQKKHMNEITQNNKIRLNHYRIQSFEYFKNVKMTRGDVSVQTNESIRDLTYFENYTKIATIKDDILKQIVENGYNNLNKQPNTAVIVEPRFLKHLPFVINDFYKKLGQGWKVVFYCGEGLKNIWLDLINNEDIEIRELKNNCYKYNEYCDFIKSKELWENLYGDYVLVFTANSTIINKPPYTIDYYMSLNKSYIGGNQCYLWNEMKRENIYPQSCNFQGGLSLRKRLDMIKIIDTFGSSKTSENCQQSQSLLTDAEDVYFAIGCYKLGLPVGDDVISSHFSVHNYLKDGFFGANCLAPGYYLNLIQKYDNICDNIYLFKDISYIDSEILSLHPSTGFFSNCTVKLFDIILYFNAVKKLPIFVDSSKQLDLYKFGTNMNDITHQYFSNNLDYEINYEYPIDFREQYQYSNYENLNFKDLTHFVKKYFTPSEDIKNDINYIENKYNINNYHDICVLFYRGNDKATEIKLPSYESIVEKARTLYNENNNIKFLVQSDEIEFIERMIQEFPNNSFYFKDEIRTIKKTNQLSVDKVNKESNFVYSQYYLAITIIMSKCKYIVCNTGNCSLWIALFRGNTDNLYQIV